ncbi:MAG TPA: winged helix-turn-helix domain-containing protein [Steroidobacteraceae bacterium]|jgi:non-specific serine/threonine protein kinase|nr:winged helix-turn-helix domain-containing protein [Steroidobacteraceae bacterium]
MVRRSAVIDSSHGHARGSRTTYELGPFLLDPVAGVLLRAGVTEGLGPRAIAVLARLVEHAGEPVAKRTLMQAAWAGLVVEDANLTVQISAIRRVLEKVAGGERWLETLARRGYRFIGPVIELCDGRPRPARRQNIGHLPEPLSSFVGRERELVDLKRLLAKNRLLTLVGAGGIGKTRLAVQVAAEARDAYRDGIWFIDLAPLADPALVPVIAAQILGVPQAPDRPLIEALSRRVRGQRLLLILDNCEHVLDAAARLAEGLLQTAPEPTILATSREPLRIAGEQLYRLQALSLPGASADFEDIRHSESVLLFVDRAQHMQHDFTLTPEAAPTVAQLCVRLDGIPMALELAAALASTSSIEDIDAGLQFRFDLLTQGSRTALPRQQTLRATLDWSFDLLSDEERQVLRRACVFTGGFTEDAAASVVCDETLHSSRVNDLLRRLATRSLSLAQAGEGEIRYRLLETTRAYGQEKLDAAGETVATRQRHAEHFRRALETAEDAWLRLSDSEWRARHLPDVDNVRAALDWSLGRKGDATLAIALAGASGPMWGGLSLYGEGIERLEAASARLPAAATRCEQARLWLWFGFLLEASAPSRAIAAFRRSLDLYGTLGNARGIAQAATWLSHALTIVGQYEASASALATALPALERARLPKLRAFHLANTGFLKTQTNHLAEAQTLYLESSALYRDVGSAVGAAASLHNVANVSWALGDTAVAESAFREVVALHRNSGHRGKEPLGFSLGNLAGVLTERGKLAEALETAREALPLLHGAESAWLLIDHLALRAALAGKLQTAVTIAGFADAAHVAKSATRQVNEARVRERVDALARDHFDAATLARHLEHGGGISAAEACRLALED